MQQEPGLRVAPPNIERHCAAGYALLASCVLPAGTALPPGYDWEGQECLDSMKVGLLAGGATFCDDAWGSATRKWALLAGLPASYLDGAGFEVRTSFAFALVCSPCHGPESDAALAQLLFVGNLDPDARDEDGITLLLRCAEHDRDRMAQHLLDAGVDPSLAAAFAWMPAGTERVCALALALRLGNESTALALRAQRAPGDHRRAGRGRLKQPGPDSVQSSHVVGVVSWPDR